MAVAAGCRSDPRIVWLAAEVAGAAEVDRCPGSDRSDQLGPEFDRSVPGRTTMAVGRGHLLPVHLHRRGPGQRRSTR